MYICNKQLDFYYFQIYVWQFPTYTAIYEETLVLYGLKNAFSLKLVNHLHCSCSARVARFQETVK